MTSTQRNNSRVVTHCRGVHGGRPTECAQDRLPPRQWSICGATGRVKHVCAARPLVISANRVRSGQAATPAAKHLWGYRESETCVCGAAKCDLGQPSALRTGCHPGSEASVGLQGEWNLCVRRGHICELGHIMTNCRHFGERPNRDEIAGMEDRAVRWMNAVGDTIWMKCVRYIYLQLLSGFALFWILCMAFLCRPHASIPYVIMW